MKFRFFFKIKFKKMSTMLLLLNRAVALRDRLHVEDITSVHRCLCQLLHPSPTHAYKMALLTASCASLFSYFHFLMKFRDKIRNETVEREEFIAVFSSKRFEWESTLKSHHEREKYLFICDRMARLYDHEIGVDALLQAIVMKDVITGEDEESA